MAVSIQQARPRVTLWTGDDGTEQVELDNDLLGFTVQKSLGAAAGRFSITLAPRQARSGLGPSNASKLAWLYGSLRVNHVVSLGYHRDGGMMMGLVDRYGESAKLDGGQISRTLTIQGSCLGKVLAADGIILSSLKVPATADFIKKIQAALGEDHPLVTWVRGVWGPKWGKPDNPSYTYKGASPRDVALFALKSTPTTRIPILQKVFGGQGEAGDWMTVRATDWNDERIYNEGLSNYQGNIWGLINATLDADFYEIRVDYQPQDPTAPVGGNVRIALPELIIRPKPFDESQLERANVPDDTGLDWDMLRTYVGDLEHHEIPLEEVLGYDFGLDADEAFSHYSVTSDYALPGNTASYDEGLAYPTVDTYNGKKYGLKAYRGTLALLSPNLILKADNEVDAGQVWDDVRRYRNRLINWYWMNPRFERGTIRVIGRDEFRVGDPIWLPWRHPPLKPGDEHVTMGMRYYCIGVSQAWQLGDRLVTTLQLVRGHNPGLVGAEKAAISKDAPSESPLHLAET